MNKKTVEEHLTNARLVHGDRYDYSLINFIKSNKDYVKIICKTHGVFSQSLSGHINARQGCPKCSGNSKKTLEEVIIKAKEVHKNKYTYKTTHYTGNRQKFCIVCPAHGEFNQGIKEHLNGVGCPRCKKNFKKNTQSFIEAAKKIHGDKYDYSKVDYKGNAVPIIVICRKHGEFSQTPHNQLAGYGCSRCVRNSSKVENAWLDSLNNPNIIRQHKLKINGKTFNFDGFDPTTNTAYEFHGSMFHGHPKFYNPLDLCPLGKTYFFKLFEKTGRRDKLIKDAGINLVVIWEHEWYEKLGKEYKISSIKPNYQGHRAHDRNLDDLNLTGPLYD